MKHLKASLLITICLCVPNIWASSDDRSICHSSGIDPRLGAAWASIEASSNTTNQALDRHRDNLAHLSDICRADRARLMSDASNELATIIKSMLNEGLLNPTVLTDELALLQAEERETGRALELAIDSGDDAKINTAGDTATLSSINRAMFEYEFLNRLASDSDKVFENEGIDSVSSDIDQLANIAEHEKLSDFVTWSLNVLNAAESFGDEAMVSVARDHFLKAYDQQDTLEAAAYPGRLRIEIKDKDHECFIWGRRMQALRQQQKIADKNYYNKHTEFNKKYPHNPVENQSFTFMGEKEIEDLIESLKDEITLEMKVDLTELLRLKQVRGGVTKNYSESYDKWQSIKNDLLNLTRRYMETFPNTLIRLTSQVVIDEENEREAKMYAEMEAAVAAKVAWDEHVACAVVSYGDSDESRSSAFKQNTVIELLADLRLSGERQTALNALYDVFRRQGQPENLGNHTVKNEFEIGKAEFYQQYFSSEEGQVRTAEKLIELEQKIQYLKDAFNTVCQALENNKVEVTTEEQELAIGRNGWSLSFLRNMYEAHHTVLKDFLNSVATAAAAAAAAESSDDEWATGALVEDGVIAELNAISQANLDLTDDQQTALNELFDISMDAAALERSLVSAAHVRDVAEMTRLRVRLAAAKRAEEEAWNRYTKEYIYSPQGMLRTPSKLEDLQQKIHFLKSLHERAERLLDKISSQADGVQADAIASKFFSIGFLIGLYERHYCMLKEFLDSHPPIMPDAAVEGGSDDDVGEASDSANPYTRPAEGSLRGFVKELAKQSAELDLI